MVRLACIAPELPVAELQRSLDYYKEKLGFDVAMQLADYAVVERDDVAIHLFQADASGASPVAIHIFTQDLDMLQAELERRGGVHCATNCTEAVGQSRLSRHRRLGQCDQVYRTAGGRLRSVEICATEEIAACTTDQLAPALFQP